MLNRIPIAVIGLLLSASAMAGVYRWVDAQGNVHYTDKPQGQAEKVEIESRPTDQARIAAQREASLNQASEHEESRQKQLAADKEQQAKDQDEATEKAANCTRATERLERYETAHRLYKPLEGGERQYLSDDEIDQARLDAKAERDRWCN